MSIMGAGIALALAIAFVSLHDKASAVEAAPVTAQATAPVNARQSLIHQPRPLLPEPDAPRSTTVSSSKILSLRQPCWVRR